MLRAVSRLISFEVLGSPSVGLRAVSSQGWGVRPLPGPSHGGLGGNLHCEIGPSEALPQSLRSWKETKIPWRGNETTTWSQRRQYRKRYPAYYLSKLDQEMPLATKSVRRSTFSVQRLADGVME